MSPSDDHLTTESRDSGSAHSPSGCAAGDAASSDGDWASLFGDGDSGDDQESLVIDTTPPAVYPMLTTTSAAPSALTFPSTPARTETSQPAQKPPPPPLTLPMPTPLSSMGDLALPTVLTAGASIGLEPHLALPALSPGDAPAPEQPDVSIQDGLQFDDHDHFGVDEQETAWLLEAELDKDELGFRREAQVDFATSEPGPGRDDQAHPDDIGAPLIWEPLPLARTDPIVGSDVQHDPSFDVGLGWDDPSPTPAVEFPDFDFDIGPDSASSAPDPALMLGATYVPLVSARRYLFPHVLELPRRIHGPDRDPGMLVDHLRISSSTIPSTDLLADLHMDKPSQEALSLDFGTFLELPGIDARMKELNESQDMYAKRYLVGLLILDFLRHDGRGEKYFGSGNHPSPLWPDDSTKLVCSLSVFAGREITKAKNRARRARATPGPQAPRGPRVPRAPQADQADQATQSAQARSELVLLTPADFERGGRYERKRAASRPAIPPPKRPSPVPLPSGVRESAFGQAAAMRVLSDSGRPTDFERRNLSKLLIGLGSNPNQPIQEPTPPETPATSAAPTPAIVAAAEITDLKQQQADGRAGEPEPRRAPSSSSAAKLRYSVWLVDAKSDVETPVLGIGHEQEEGLWEDGFARVRSHCVRLGLEPVVEVLTPANGLVVVDDQRSWDQAVDAVRQRPMMEGIVKVRLSARSGRGADGV